MSVAPRIVRCGPVELRLVTPRDAARMFAYARDPETSRMLQWPPHRTVDDTLEFVHDCRRLWSTGAAWLPGIYDSASGELLGSTGVFGIDRANRRGEVGTWLGVPHQGRGLNRAAKAAVVAFAREHLGLERLEFLVRVDNERSLRAMRALPGLREEGVLAARLVRDGVAHDAVLFAWLARDHDPAAWPPVTSDPGSADDDA